MAEPRMPYAGVPLDRAPKRRTDPGWVARRLSDPDTRVVPVWRGLPMVDERLSAVLRKAAGVPDLIAELTAAETVQPVFLGVDNVGVAAFAADLSAHDEEAAVALGGGTGGFVDLRRSGPVMCADDAALAAYARALVEFGRYHRYCSRCGYPTEARHGGHMRQCTDPSCSQEVFPRIEPAVIMLVELPPSGGQPARCLLGRQRPLPLGTYSTLAGFVEPGESLEEAVAREIHEEVGVRVADVSYHASQPWPFPRGIMIGFHARARSAGIDVDPEELEDARWFTAAELGAFAEPDDLTAPLRLPPADSISRCLVESWLGSNASIR